ncbi:uncharacterized protein CMU_033960 [Cryptosporidium muris RN66]|uniref:FACT complex subunit n=1 Tax=Cryptosporidium muris (strain RN66) TaxID=441375 RepID=B6AFM0_CRYMR|nr:uncharacterized protein CMU_033960 [Cryptosporidium muris RN66]EEA07011.1 hypothetical protein, conserved [Cryptosporidium muris RN66]|eukprot:XP_002141360.1 hypothetical protein [Cryptosporidium muris RN66]
MGKEEVTLDVVSFGNRLRFLFSIWVDRDNPFASVGTILPLQQIDSLLILCGKGSAQDDGSIYKSTTIHYWLFGFEFSDTLLLLTRTKEIVILTSSKKVAIFKQLVDTAPSHYPSIKVTLIERNNNDEPLERLGRICVDVTDGNNMNLGRVEDITKQRTQFISQCEEYFKSNEPFSSATVTLVNHALSYILCYKDSIELSLCKKASTLSVQMIKNIILQRIEVILDKEFQETHQSIGKRAEKALDDTNILKTWQAKYELDPSDVDLVYALIQSGHNFELKAVENTTENLCLTSGCILLSVGSKYREYCANITRTYFLNATDEQKEIYNYTLSLMEYIVLLLKPNIPFRKIYQDVLDKITNDKGVEMSQKFVNSVGHCIGIEFRDSLLIIGPKTPLDVVVQNGMTFNLSVGFNDLTSSNIKYAVWICDTVYLSTDNTVEILTQSCSKRLEHVSYELEDIDIEQTKTHIKKETTQQMNKKDYLTHEDEYSTSDDKRTDNSSRKNKSISNNAVLQERFRKTRSRILNNDHAEELKELENYQRELRKKKLVELQNRFGEEKEKDNNDLIKSTSDQNYYFNSKLVSYDSVLGYPRDRNLNRIYVDSAKESILIPIYGMLVPFHVRSLKNAVCTQEEGKKSFILRINFALPTGQLLDQMPNSLSSPIFIKELMIRSEDGRTLNSIFRSIKELIKRFKQKGSLEDEKAEQDFLKKQQPLELNRNSPRIVLKDIGIRPTLGQGRRQHGILEAHVNGLRFNSSKGETMDILYSSIKYAIFQPVENDLIVLLHLHLRYSLWFGKKKTQDVQFYMEVGSQADDLDQRRGRNIYDPDEILEEQREREVKKRYNTEFKRFTQGIEELSKNMFEIEIPYRDLGFYGVPGRAGVSNVQLYPTASCLVHLLEWPPFILSLDEIEIVSFERVEQGLRNFDMIFVFKDYTKTVKRVDSIPIEYLDTIKRWLNEMDIVYYEGRQNLNWNAVLKTILSDIEDFIENGGFSGFLGEESEVENTSEDDDEDEEYSETEEDMEDDEEGDSDEDLSDLEEESSDDSFKELSSDEEQGLSWDELEREAIREDRKRHREENNKVKDRRRH